MKERPQGEIEGLAYSGNAEGAWLPSRMQLYETLVPNLRARLALEMIERWGGVAADVDGEDSSGRAKLILQTPEVLVERACVTANLAIDELKRRGWLLKVPVPDPEKFASKEYKITAGGG